MLPSVVLVLLSAVTQTATAAVTGKKGDPHHHLRREQTQEQSNDDDNDGGPGYGYGPSRPPYVANSGRANAIKDVFRVSWEGYRKHAFGHDSLRPQSNSWEDDR
jgi:hypothetical protein